MTMLIRFKPSALKQTHGYEYLVRFGLGGLATVLAGIAAKAFGPAFGGLFLAFPAIFCASATLIDKHERERKARKGLAGRKRGRFAAALDGAGAGWGSLALAAFGFLVWKEAWLVAIPVLSMASVAWLLIAVSLRFLRQKLR